MGRHYEGAGILAVAKDHRGYDRLLLGFRRHNPFRDTWTVPGGRVEKEDGAGPERFLNGAIREAEEEIGFPLSFGFDGDESGLMKEGEWRAHMTAIASVDPFVGKLVQVFVEDVIAARFGHGGTVSSPLSRHAILHGGDMSYGTEVNSRTAILLVDYFAFVSRLRRVVEGNDAAPTTRK